MKTLREMLGQDAGAVLSPTLRALDNNQFAEMTSAPGNRITYHRTSDGFTLRGEYWSRFLSPDEPGIERRTIYDQDGFELVREHLKLHMIVFDDMTFSQINFRNTGWSYERGIWVITGIHGTRELQVPTQVHLKRHPLDQPHDHALWAFANNADQIRAILCGKR